MKKLIFILFIFLLKCTLAFSQDFNDKIITLAGDTIRCQITLVNNNNIFYNIQVKRNIKNEYISLQKVKNYILDKDSKPEIYVHGKWNILAISGKQDSLRKSKRLIIEQIKLPKGNKQLKYIFLDQGQKIKITYKNDSVVRGKIEFVNDSSVIIKNRSIKINEINSITKGVGGRLLIVGVSSTALFAILAAVTANQPYNDNSMFGSPVYLFLPLAFYDLLIMVPIGIIELASTKHYRMNDNWKIVISK